MVRILIVEDEPAMQLGLKDNLEFEGYEVDVVGDGKQGLDAILNNNYNLVVLDVMLPELSGFDVCKKVRAAGNQTPVILLTAKGEEIDKVLGLEFGADDYITKPFSLRELLARIKANLRRYSPEEKQPDFILGRLKLNPDTYQAEETESGEEVTLSHKEFEILKYLIAHQNQVVSRYDLLENVWGYDEQPTTRTVDNFIARLRQKLETDHNNPSIIITVHGTGYKLVR